MKTATRTPRLCQDVALTACARLDEQRRQSKAGSHGEVIVDRKSIIQGHARRVYSVDDVKQVQTHLVSPNKCSTTRIVNVIVTRWFGGIQIGPDRVRHITNASKQAIQQAGLLNK
ncbi:hypothetical protein HW555_001010 [Spodoptera exigua]|uniref:Impact N-terminal domain-containing protein n=1 Tax=Spodoptera exigua TaxID=7107 RepID=A0A835L8C9_SPOEX|nr:hypothetical protein HW555_001010 [Spodoptera exigua]